MINYEDFDPELLELVRDDELNEYFILYNGRSLIIKFKTNPVFMMIRSGLLKKLTLLLGVCALSCPVNEFDRISDARVVMFSSLPFLYNRPYPHWDIKVE